MGDECHLEGEGDDAHAILVSMGFQHCDAKKALNLFGNADDAANSLLSSVNNDTNEIYSEQLYYDDGIGTEEEQINFSLDDMQWYLDTARNVMNTYAIDEGNGLICEEEADLLSWAKELLKQDSIQNADGNPYDSLRQSRIVQLCLRYNDLAARLGRLYEDVKDKSNENLAAARKVQRNKRQEINYSEGLEGLLQQSDEIREETHQLREIVFKFTKFPFRVHETTYEEIYLFMKELIHNDEDLNNDDVKTRINEYVFSRVNSSFGTSFLPCLLELLLSENQEVILMRRINEECEDTVDVQPSNESDEAVLAASISRIQCIHSEEMDNLRMALGHDESNDDRTRSMCTGMKRKQVMVVDAANKANHCKISEEDLATINAQVVAELKQEYTRDVLNLSARVEEERERQQLRVKERKRRKTKLSGEISQRMKSTVGDMVGSSVPLAHDDPTAKYNRNVDALEGLLLQMADSSSFLEEAFADHKESIMKTVKTDFPSVSSSFAEAYVSELNSRLKRGLSEMEEQIVRAFVNQMFDTSNSTGKSNQWLHQALVEMREKRRVHFSQVMNHEGGNTEEIEWVQANVDKELQIRDELFAHFDSSLERLQCDHSMVGDPIDSGPETMPSSADTPYSKDTLDLLTKLKTTRQEALCKIEEKWGQRKEAAREEGGADKSDKETHGEINALELEELAACEKRLTLNEFRTLELHKEVFRKQGIDLNVHDLVAEIHKDFSVERTRLRQRVESERRRQSKEVGKKRRGVHDGKPSGDFDSEAERLSRQHKHEREALEMSLDVEQARQRQALQERLASKRRHRRESKVFLENVLPPVVRKQGKGLN